MDRAWWDKYRHQVQAEFSGKCYTFGSGIYNVLPSGMKDHYQNSGAGAIALAAHLGARKIVLLGYDCRHKDGKTHWHGNHPSGLGNAGKVGDWPEQFGRLSRDLLKIEGMQVVNCTRDTALTCFTKKPLEEVLCEPSLLPVGRAPEVLSLQAV